MSHVATIEIQIKDLAALKQAAKDLGLEFRENQKTYRWYGYSVGDYPLPAGFTEAELGKCEHALSLGDAHRTFTVGSGTHNYGAPPYEVGITRRKDGKPGYVLLWDFWNHGLGLEDVVGKNAEKLVQRYAVNVAKNKVKAQGYAVTEARKQDGTVVLQAVRRPGR